MVQDQVAHLPDRRRFLEISCAVCVVALTAGLAGLHAPPAHAQSSLKLASITTGFAAGGSSDVTARILADKLRGTYAETIVVDSRVGAGGRLAVEYVKNARSDGSSILLSPGGMMVMFPHIYKNLRYDPLQDFTPVTMVVKFPFVLAISTLVPPDVRTLADFLNWAKANPKSASYGSPGEGTRTHFVGVMLGRSAGLAYTHVPYKGMAPMVQDLMGGQIASGILTPADAAPLLQSGKVRIVATTGASRSRFMPDIPTFKEYGYKDIEVEEMYALFVPSSTSAQAVDRLAELVRQTLTLADVQAKFEQMALEPVGNSPAEFKAFIKAEYERWGAIARASGFTPTE